jgi:hypothetical protein
MKANAKPKDNRKFIPHLFVAIIGRGVALSAPTIVAQASEFGYHVAFVATKGCSPGSRPSGNLRAILRSSGRRVNLAIGTETVDPVSGAAPHRCYPDVRDPKNPRPVAFMPWYVGGRYAHVSIHYPEFADQVLAIVDMAEPTRPEVVGKWWIPGVWTSGGETPRWPKGRRYALHHALVAGNLAYGAWRDGGLTVLDVGDPTRPKLLAHRNLDPPFGGGTHSPLPLPDRNLLVPADEANFADCSLGVRHTWLFDVHEPTNPVSFATMPVPSEADYCAKGGNFGPHNLWENRPGAFQSSRFIFATYHSFPAEKGSPVRQ